jgi:hypothetical protein
VIDQQLAPADGTVREVTASTFLLRREAGDWQVGLIFHDRLGSHMPTGVQAGSLRVPMKASSHCSW